MASTRSQNSDFTVLVVDARCAKALRVAYLYDHSIVTVPHYPGTRTLRVAYLYIILPKHTQALQSALYRAFTKERSRYTTVRLRGMGTRPMGTILTFAAGVPRKIGTLLQ